MNTELSDQERRALNEFLGAHWSEFLEEVAERFLSPEEAEELGEKLEGRK